MELYQLLAVVDRETEPRLEGVFTSAGTVVGLSQPASGTAGSEILKRFGLASTEKRIVMTVATGAQQRMIFQMARKLLYLDIPGNGILAAIPIKAVAGRQTLSYLTDSEITGGTPSMDFEYELIVVVINAGYADTVMDAAREAGAGGGTVLHAKGTGSMRGEKFYNMRFADEKDMVYIVAHKSEKAAVMKAVNQKAGPDTEARGICFSLPISSVMGLRSRVMDDAESEK
jgi:nitrogen regulatory protein PII